MTVATFVSHWIDQAKAQGFSLQAIQAEFNLRKNLQEAAADMSEIPNDQALKMIFGIWCRLFGLTNPWLICRIS